MPTLRRLASTDDGRIGLDGSEFRLSLGDLGLKKDVIWRWAGSADAPAKGRFVRGVDIVVDLKFEVYEWSMMIVGRELMGLMG